MPHSIYTIHIHLKERPQILEDIWKGPAVNVMDAFAQARRAYLGAGYTRFDLTQQSIITLLGRREDA